MRGFAKLEKAKVKMQEKKFTIDLLCSSCTIENVVLVE